MRGIVDRIMEKDDGFFGFIKTRSNETHYFNSRCLTEGTTVKKGSVVTFDVRLLPDGKTRAERVSIFKPVALSANSRKNVEEALYSKLEEKCAVDCSVIPGILSQVDVDYEKHATDLNDFFDTFFKGVFAIKKNVKMNGRTYPSVVVAIAKPCVLPEKKVQELVEMISEELKKRVYIQCSTLPEKLEKLDIDYRIYASSLSSFVQIYLAKHFIFREKITVNGKSISNVLFPHDADIEKYLAEQNSQMQPHILEKFREYMEKKDYFGLLSSVEFRTTAPNKMGTECILIALRAVAGYFGDSIDITLNEFQRNLIELEHAADLVRLKNNEKILMQGIESSSAHTSMEVFKNVFSNVCHGKNNNHSNWNALVERFGSLRNELYFYFVALWIASASNKERCVEFYVSEGVKTKDMKRIADLLGMCKDFSVEENFTLTLRLKKIIVGKCLESDNIEPLCRAIEFFDEQTMPEALELPAYLTAEKGVDSDILIGFFTSTIESLIAEKLVNYFWYKAKSDREFEEIAKTMFWVCGKYDQAYIEAIIYNDTYADFGLRRKADILQKYFDYLCDCAESDDTAYMLANYVYVHFVEDPNYSTNASVAQHTARWETLKEHVMSRIRKQIDDSSSIAIPNRLFRFDAVALMKIENYYCEKFIRPQLEECSGEERDKLLEEFSNSSQQYIARWIKLNYGTSLEQNLEALLQSRLFTDAIRMIQSNNELSAEKKNESLCRIICENFSVRGFKESACDIFAGSFTAEAAEEILLSGYSSGTDDMIEALFAIYSYQKSWLKLAYMYAPYKAIRGENRPKTYDFIKDILQKKAGFEVKKMAFNHYEVLRQAIKILSNSEFDEFIEWAKRISIPYGSKSYTIDTRTFDQNFKTMLSGADYDTCWDSILLMAIKTDNAERQDILRYCIITSYIGRYGIEKFERKINPLLKWKGNVQDSFSPYMGMWKGLLGGKYSCNVISLNTPLVSEVPATYWHIFYDVAVCKARVFSLEHLICRQLRACDHDMQGFYDALVCQYADSREPVFLQIAVKLLVQFDGIIQTHFDRYLTYCNSNKPKIFLFNALIALLAQNRYVDEIGEFLSSSCWNNTETERRLIMMLELICGSNLDEFNETLGLELDAYERSRFASDFLAVFADYPNIDVVGVIRACDSSEKYRFDLIKHVMSTQYSQGQFSILQDTGLIFPPELTPENADVVRSYLEMMALCYRKQSQRNDVQHLIWVRNRYHRILAADILLSEEPVAFNDEDIVALMQSNKHYADVNGNYQRFRKFMYSFIGSDKVTPQLRTWVLASVISNEWKDFIDHMSEYVDEDLASINSMMELSNYRELNIQILVKYIISKKCEYSEDDVRLVRSYSAKLGYVLEELQKIKRNDEDNFQEVLSVISSICRLTNPHKPNVSYTNLDHHLVRNGELVHKYFDLFTTAFWEVNYSSTIEYLFGEDVRSAKKRCELQKVKRWKPIFRSVHNISVYYYLAAAWYALARDRDNAKVAYEQIVSMSDIPAEWSQERKDLEAYISGDAKTFFTSSSKYISVLSTETAAGRLDFITSAVGEHKYSAEDAASAYKTILEVSNRAAQLNAHKKLFGFISKPDDLYEVFRHIDSHKEKYERKTYNELVIGFGSLLITEDKLSLSDDSKYLILDSIFDVYEQLSDVGKEKVSVREHLRSAESCVLGTSGLSLSVWLENFDRIKTIMSHPAVGNPDVILRDLSEPVEQCIKAFEKCETQMQKFDWLAEWRRNRNTPPDCSDYERVFIEAVDNELQRIGNSACLKLKILNDGNLIEDGSIFYQVENLPEKSGASVLLDNGTKPSCAQLEVRIGINGAAPILYENDGFSNSVELRPGDICGQLYRIHSSVLSALSPGDVIEVIHSIIIDGVVICNNDGDNRKFTYTNESGVLKPDIVSGELYDDESPAFTDVTRGFGRESEKEKIRERLNHKLVIVYGPSRVGKSSLLNYIKSEYADEYLRRFGDSGRSIIAISIADDRNGDDYLRNMGDRSQDIIEYEAQQLLEYLFTAPLKAVFCSNPHRVQRSRRKVIGKEFSESVNDDILSILASTESSVRDKYTAISEVLKKNNCEIWLLFDEFQQVVGRLNGAVGELVQLCNEIKKYLEGFRLVICGSDDLLRIFECGNDPYWSGFITTTSNSKVPVGQLEYDDFVEMMKDSEIWTTPEDAKPFSDEAFELLHRYTGGNAICGKIFGNELLSRIRKGDYSDRRKIYPSDITQIAYELLYSEVGPVRTQLIAHNEKNLENEKKYLLFIASELSADHNRADVSLSEIREFFFARSTTEIDLALKILVARGILRYSDDRMSYSFTTMFYFDFFRSQATKAVMMMLREAEEDAGNQTTVEQASASVDIDLLNYFLKQDPKRQAQLLGGLMLSSDNSVKAAAHELVGDNKVTTNVQINAQTINTAFNTLLTGDVNSEDFIKAFSSLPTVSTYLSESQRKDLLALSAELSDCDTPEDIRDTEMRMEALVAPAQQQMFRDTVGAVVASDDFTDVSKERWIELLGLRDSDELAKIHELPTEIVTPLNFAVMLHNVFDKIHQRMQGESVSENDRELDFCPVSIMYCKVVEVALKKLHTPIYIRKIPGATLKSFDGPRFSDLLDDDGVTIRLSKDLTIGSFAFNIASTDRNNDINNPSDFKVYPKRNPIRQITGNRNDSSAVNSEWITHAEALAIILAIRNKSAHEAVPITKENFMWLIKTLFERSELIRIFSLSEEN